MAVSLVANVMVLIEVWLQGSQYLVFVTEHGIALILEQSLIN